MMSSELVPLSYARDAYNVLHGTELETHTAALTAEQAARINNTYDIEVHVGTHGLPPGAQPYSSESESLLMLPTQQEYDEAAAVVAGMQPGDTLFLESYGFVSHPLEPTVVPDHLPTAFDEGSPAFAQRPLGLLALSMAHAKRAEALRDLERARRDYRIDAYDYARQLAALKGVRTVYADQDAFDREPLQALTGGRDMSELILSPDSEDKALAERVNAQRERAACNLTKDWALDHLPPRGHPYAKRPQTQVGIAVWQSAQGRVGTGIW